MKAVTLTVSVTAEPDDYEYVSLVHYLSPRRVWQYRG